jgi:hypothetical protein
MLPLASPEFFDGPSALSEEDILGLLSELIEGRGAEAFGDGHAVALFEEYLESCGQAEADGEDKAARFLDLTGALDDLRLACNGGDRRACADRQAVLDLLEETLKTQSLAPVDLIMTGKMFNDAGWAVPDCLKDAVAQALRSDAGSGAQVTSSSLSLLFSEISGGEDGDPFTIHEFLASLIASLPTGAIGQIFAALTALRRADVMHALAGFVLHPDDSVAKAAMGSLRTLGQHAPVESLLIERLVHMRSWLPPSRQEDLDGTIKALRLHAAPPKNRKRGVIIECSASICDGSGTRAVSVAQRVGAQHHFISVMLKPSGISDVMMVPDLSGSQIKELLRQIKTEVPAGKTDLDGIIRLLSLGLADNAAAGQLPPFRFIETVEALGLPPLRADHASAAEICAELLAALPDDQTTTEATELAYAALIDKEFVENWFEVSDELDEILHPIKSFRKRVAAVLEDYLPSRRPYWARLCALSALAMRGQARSGTWKELALAGRDLASDLPLERIPLMVQIAVNSVGAFEQQM